MSDISSSIWETTYNGYFFLSLAGILVGGLHLCLKYCERSTCSRCKLGCFEVDREIPLVSLRRANSDSLP